MYFQRNNPKKKGTNIEFIKKIDDNILITTELSITDNYVYVASMFPSAQNKSISFLNSQYF